MISKIIIHSLCHIKFGFSCRFIFCFNESKIFAHNAYFSSWVLIKFWSLTGSPCAIVHDLDESMSILCFEKDNLLSLVCKTYILNTKQIQTNCISGKVRDYQFEKLYSIVVEIKIIDQFSIIINDWNTTSYRTID